MRNAKYSIGEKARLRGAKFIHWDITEVEKRVMNVTKTTGMNIKSCKYPIESLGIDELLYNLPSKSSHIGSEKW